jgi:hypothetical protein
MTNGLQHPHLIPIILIIILLIIIPWLPCLFPFLGNATHNTSNDFKSYNPIYNAILMLGVQQHVFRGSVVVKALWYNPEGRGPRPDEVNDVYQLI